MYTSRSHPVHAGLIRGWFALTIHLITVAAASAQVVVTDTKRFANDAEVDPELLVIESDSALVPVVPVFQPTRRSQSLTALDPRRRGFGLGGSGRTVSILQSGRGGGPRVGCPDEGFSDRAYARDSGNDWPWLPANTLVADDLTLEPGNWVVSCYDVLIYADNNPSFGCNQSRTVTLRAYDDCSGAVIPGSEESWSVPPHGGPILLTGVTNIDFSASGTIWFGITTDINECDGWYIGQTQANGSTTNVFQLETDCAACINPPTCSPWAGFIVVLYGCKLPEIVSHPQDATVCVGGWNQFCVNATGGTPLSYQWQLDEVDIVPATSPCHVATTAGAYRCIVTDSCGTTTSNSATLTLSTGPTITTSPTGGTTCPAQPLQLCVVAQGTGQLHYQWKRNGLSLIGATSSCHTATALGDYTCVVMDDCGSTVSDAASVQAIGTGDLDGDGEATPADINAFVLVLLGEDTLPEHVEAADTNCDRSTDGRDVPSFVALLLATP